MSREKLAPLFITGTWRCGSTLISRIMNSHPEMEVVYDLIHFMRFCYNQYNPISDLSNVNKLISDINRRIKERYDLEFSVKDVLAEMQDDRTYASVYNSIMKVCLLKKSTKLFWGEKTNLAWTKIPLFFDMFPKGRVLHMIRDPRAVLASWKKFTNSPGNDYLDSILNSYDSMERAVQYSEQFSQYRYLFIMYEELVARPQETVNKICNKFDMSYDEGMLDLANFKNNAGKQWKSNTVRNEALKGISVSMVDRWRTELEAWEIVLTELIMKDYLKKFGYSMSNIEVDEQLINQGISEVRKSDLSSEGLIKFLLTKKGFERYPTNPLAKENWAEIRIED